MQSNKQQEGGVAIKDQERREDEEMITPCGSPFSSDTTATNSSRATDTPKDTTSSRDEDFHEELASTAELDSPMSCEQITNEIPEEKVFLDDGKGDGEEEESEWVILEREKNCQE